MGSAVSYWKYVRIGGAWLYKACVMDRGVPVKDMVLVDKRSTYHPEGTYYLRHRKQWIRAGNTPEEAVDTSLQLLSGNYATPTTLAVEADEFCAAHAVGKSPKTIQNMRHVLTRFLAVCDARNVRAVAKNHIQEYWQWEVDNSPTHSYRTAHNRVETLNTFLKEKGVDLVGRGKNSAGERRWTIPPYVEETPEVFEQNEIDALLGVCDSKHKAAYSAMLKGLMREGEVMHLTWDRVDVKRSVIHIKEQPQYGWKPKKNCERSVKVPRSLMDLIDALPRTSRLVFPREDGRPDGHLLRYIKEAARRAGLDPDRVWNHKLRASGATVYFRAGMPLPDIMRLGGWRDFDSVRRYMGVMQDDKLEEAVEAAWA